VSELIPRLDTAEVGFDRRLDVLLAWEGVSDASVQHTVADIVARVRTEGDRALLEFTNRHFDGLADGRCRASGGAAASV
jgi:histidinol dehydrogenase